MFSMLLIGCCLTIPQEVVITSSTITFRELANVAPADPRAAVSFGSAPAPGLAKRLGRQEIVSKLAALSLSSDDLEVPLSVLVRRRSTNLDAVHVTEAIRQALAEKFSGSAVDVESVQVPDTPIAADEVRLRASLPARVDPTTTVFVRVDVVGTNYLRTVFVPTRLKVERIQPVLKRSVAAHEPIRADLVEWKPMPVVTTREGFDSPEALEGHVAKRDLEQGQVLTSDLLYVAMMVRKGDTVTVTSSVGNVQVSATMRASASGKLGDLIAVQHLKGPGSTTAKVVGPGRLQALEGER